MISKYFVQRLLEDLELKVRDDIEFLALRRDIDVAGGDFMSELLFPELLDVFAELAADLNHHQSSIEVHGQRLVVEVFLPCAIDRDTGVADYLEYLTKRRRLSAVVYENSGDVLVGGQLVTNSIFLCHSRFLRTALLRSIAKSLAASDVCIATHNGAITAKLPTSIVRLMLERGTDLASSQLNPLYAHRFECEIAALLVSPVSIVGDTLARPRHEFSDRLDETTLHPDIARLCALQHFMRHRTRSGNRQSSLLMDWLYNLTYLYERVQSAGKFDAKLQIERCARSHVASLLRCANFGAVKHGQADLEIANDLVAGVMYVLSEHSADLRAAAAQRLTEARFTEAIVERQVADSLPRDRRHAAVLIHTERRTRDDAEQYCVTMQLPWLCERLAAGSRLRCILRIATQVDTLGHRNQWRSPLALLTALRSALPMARDGVDYLLLTSPLAYDNLYARQMTAESLPAKHTLSEWLQADVPGSRKIRPHKYANRHIAKRVELTDSAYVMVALSEALRADLQVACASMLCVQRAICVLHELRRPLNEPLTSPLLADTLAHSTDIAVLCHALNALSAQLGLAADAWSPHSARARTDAQRTARLCVRIASLLLPPLGAEEEERPLDTLPAAALSVVTAVIERFQPPAPASVAAPVAASDKCLIGALQVVLVGNLAPLIVPAAAERNTKWILNDEIDAQRKKLAADLPLAVKYAEERRERDRPAKRRRRRGPKDTNSDDDKEATEDNVFETHGIPGDAPIVDCACGASARTCERLSGAQLDDSPIHGVACCVCDLHLISDEAGRAEITGCLCKYCCTRVGCTSSTPLEIADTSEWHEVARPTSTVDVLQYIEVVVERAEGDDKEYADICKEVLLSMRNRLAAWVSTTQKPRTYRHRFQRHAHRTPSEAQRVLQNGIVKYADFVARLPPKYYHHVMSKVLQSSIEEPRRNMLLHTHTIIDGLAAASDEQVERSTPSFALGLCMSVLEVMQSWYQEPVADLWECQRNRTIPEHRRAAIVTYLVPFENVEYYSAYIAHQRAGLLFPLMSSALVEHSAWGTASNTTALNNTHHALNRRLERLLDTDLRPRPLTDAPANMMSTLLLNWYVDH